MTEAKMESHRRSVKAWANRNPEKRREINRRYRERNKARLREMQKRRWAALTDEEKRAATKRQYALYRKRIEANPEYAERRREQCRASSLRYIATHKAECAARHRAYVASNKDRINEHARKYWSKAENAARKRHSLKKWRETHRDEISRRRREKRAANVEAARIKEREAEARRKNRKQTDAAYYAKRRASTRVARAKRRVVDGKPYRPKFNTRIPDWATMGQNIIDLSSPWLWNNLTDSQRAYGREIAIDRYKWRTGT